LDRGHNLVAWNVSATVRNPTFEQPHNLTGRQMRVKLPCDSKEPTVNTFASSRRRDQQGAEK
jgi:hypothetical protein